MVGISVLKKKCLNSISTLQILLYIKLQNINNAALFLIFIPNVCYASFHSLRVHSFKNCTITFLKLQIRFKCLLILCNMNLHFMIYCREEHISVHRNLSYFVIWIYYDFFPKGKSSIKYRLSIHKAWWKILEGELHLKMLTFFEEWCKRNTFILHNVSRAGLIHISISTHFTKILPI